jgi:hypothetical protein
LARALWQNLAVVNILVRAIITGFGLRVGSEVAKVVSRKVNEVARQRAERRRVAAESEKEALEAEERERERERSDGDDDEDDDIPGVSPETI